MKEDVRKKISASVLEPPFYQKETRTQVFSCELLEVLNNIFFYKTSLSDSFCKSLSLGV